MLVCDGPLREELEAQAATLGVCERLIRPGAVAHGEMPHYIAAMDICVVPHSNAYRSPIKLFEYMAGRRPVVAPRTHPLPLGLRDGEKGLPFHPRNPDKLPTPFNSTFARPHLPRR